MSRRLHAVRDPKTMERDWETNSRWSGITRDYSAEDVLRLRGSIDIKYTLAEMGAERLWELLQSDPFVAALGALTGNQAIQQVRAGLKAIYLSGWQVAADANLAGQMYPDQSLYPSNSVPQVVKRINQALQRADQIDYSEGKTDTHWFAPIVADAEAGFGGCLNAFELMKMMIEAGAAGVHFEDQLASEKKCGHLGGKVLVPTSAFIRMLTAARLAADVMGVPTLVVARTDANSATLLTSDVDERDQPFITGQRTAEGFFTIKGGLEMAIARDCLCAIRRRALVRDLHARSCGGAPLCGGSAQSASRQDTGVQLLALVQLGEEARRRDHRQLPARAGGDGLQVPVRHAGWFPRAQLLDVRASASVPGGRDAGVFALAAIGVCSRGERVHGHQTST